jgi:hypothetical protein
MAEKLTPARIEEMFAAYCEHPTMEHVRRACKVNENTVRKYILHGDPSRGIEPLIVRLRRFTAAGQRATEDRLLKAKDRALLLIDALVSKIIQRVSGVKEGGVWKVEPLDPRDIEPSDLVPMIDKLMRLYAFLHGEPDQRVALQADTPEARERRWLALQERLDSLPPHVRERAKERLRLIVGGAPEATEKTA